jgi:hypothetical protein
VRLDKYGVKYNDDNAIFDRQNGLEKEAEDEV